MGKWLKWLSILAVLGFPAAVIGTRLGLFDFRVGFSVLKYTLILAIAVLLVSIVVTFLKRRSDPESAKSARIASYLALIPLLGLGTQIYTGTSLPGIHNISTDTVNPPQFNKVVELRGKDANPLEYDAAALAEVQTAAYPEVKTLVTDMPKAQAHARALQLARDFGWEIVHEDAQVGIVEATETTRLWAFKDDVVIRVTDQDGKTAVDLRSVSRVGKSDLGANAKRIKKFLSAFEK